MLPSARLEGAAQEEQESFRGSLWLEQERVYRLECSLTEQLRAPNECKWPAGGLWRPRRPEDCTLPSEVSDIDLLPLIGELIPLVAAHGIHELVFGVDVLESGLRAHAL